MSYRLWVNEERTVLVRQFSEQGVEVALRDEPGHTWGPPMLCAPEVIHSPPYEQAAKDGEATTTAEGKGSC